MSKDKEKDKAMDGQDTKDMHPDSTIITERLLIEPESGQARASLVILAGGEIGREIAIDTPEWVIGRSHHSDSYIASPSVSRRHVKITCLEDQGQRSFQIEDLNSSNGTWVNNTPVKEASLHNGDKIRIGNVLLKFVVQDEAEASFHQRVHQLIHYDRLTGLLTMEAFRRRLDSLLNQATPPPPFTLAMTDLDGLKRVNDTHGHLAGRMVVREMGAMIRKSLHNTDLAALYGGDECILLFPKASIEQAMERTERIRTTIEEREFLHNGLAFKVTISQGLAEWPRHGESVETLIAAADTALYQAKDDGRNCVRIATS